MTSVGEGALIEEPANSSKRDKLERWAFGEPLIGPLQDLAKTAAQGSWEDTVRRVGLIRLALRRFDPALAVRLTQALISPLVREATNLGYREGRGLIQRFTKAAEPLPIDPYWHRLWALVWEGPQGSVEEAEPFWHQYLGKIESATGISPDDRDRVRALVLTHLGEEFANLDLEGDGPPGSDPTIDRERQRAITHLENSLKYLPNHRATYQALMDIHEAAGQPKQVAKVALRLVEALPDDFEALMFLASHHLGLEEPHLALDFALKARKLKPLDRGVVREEWSARVALARKHALEKRWDDGRAEFATAERLDPGLALKPHFAAQKVALELKAGRTDLAEAILNETLARLPEAATLRLALAIEARRFKLTKIEVNQAEARWASELPKKVQSEAAGGLADLLGSFLVNEIKYPGRSKHLKEVVDYLKRTTRIKYNRDDLAHACAFLVDSKTVGDLAEKLAKRGRKLFPDAPEFALILGTIELKLGPYRSNFRLAHELLQSALKLATAQEATDPRSAAAIPQIRKILGGLDEMMTSPMGFPFSFPGDAGSGFPFSRGSGGLGFDPADLFGPEDDDDDEDDDDFLPPSPRPKGQGKKR